MGYYCGNPPGWHAERDYDTGGHYTGDGVTWCHGRPPEDERLYTMADAVVLGRRMLCESSDLGHQIERRGGIAVRQANGEVQDLGYGCSNCDLEIKTSYPEVPSRQQGGNGVQR